MHFFEWTICTFFLTRDGIRTTRGVQYHDTHSWEIKFQNNWGWRHKTFILRDLIYECEHVNWLLELPKYASNISPRYLISLSSGEIRVWKLDNYTLGKLRSLSLYLRTKEKFSSPNISFRLSTYIHLELHKSNILWKKINQ